MLLLLLLLLSLLCPWLLVFPEHLLLSLLHLLQLLMLLRLRLWRVCSCCECSDAALPSHCHLRCPLQLWWCCLWW